MKMGDIAAQLKSLEVEMSELSSCTIYSFLPQQYGPFMISYKTHKDKWLINELLAMRFQEEIRLIMEQREDLQSAHLIMQEKEQKLSQAKGER